MNLIQNSWTLSRTHLTFQDFFGLIQNKETSRNYS